MIQAVADNVDSATSKLQRASDEVYNWSKDWKIKMNKLKLLCVNFTNKRLTDLPTVNISGIAVPYVGTAD